MIKIRLQQEIGMCLQKKIFYRNKKKLYLRKSSFDRVRIQNESHNLNRNGGPRPSGMIRTEQQTVIHESIMSVVDTSVFSGMCRRRPESTGTTLFKDFDFINLDTDQEKKNQESP